MPNLVRHSGWFNQSRAWLTVIVGVSALFVGLQAAIVGPAPRNDCPPDCGRPPSGTPVSANLATKVPTARRAYEIPNAKLGFQPGYGVVADVPPSGLETATGRRRVVVIAAVRNDVALIGGGIGPYRQFGPDSGPGRPSPANVAIAEEMGRYVNSFMLAGDPPR